MSYSTPITISSIIDDIWLYSRYYGDMIETSKRLYDSDEYYASVLVLFDVTELIFKSVRENFNENFNQDIEYLNNNNFLTEDDYDFFNSKSFGVRKIRNIMIHRNVYQYFIEDTNGIIYQFSEIETWKLIYEKCSPNLLNIIHKVVIQSNLDYKI